MAKKTQTMLSDWMKHFDDHAKARREKDEAMQPAKYQMRYGIDYAEGILGDVQRINMLWDLVDADMLSIEDGQRIIDNHRKELEEYLDEIIWRFELDRAKFMNGRYAELKHFRKPMRLDDFADAYYHKKPYVHRVALNVDEMHKEDGHVSTELECLMSPFPGYFMTTNWKPISIIDEHVIFEVTSTDFVPDEPADLSKLEKYKPKDVKEDV